MQTYFGEKYMHFDKVSAILDSKGVLRSRGEAKRGVMWEGRGGEGVIVCYRNAIRLRTESVIGAVWS